MRQPSNVWFLAICLTIITLTGSCDRTSTNASDHPAPTSSSDEETKIQGKADRPTETEEAQPATEKTGSRFLATATLGTRKETITETMGEPDETQEIKSGRTQLTYRDVTIGEVEFAGAVLIFESSELILARLPVSVPEDRHLEYFAKMLEPTRQTWGHEDTSGLEWPWNEPFEKPLSQHLTNKAVSITALWMDEKEIRGVGVIGPEKAAIMYSRPEFMNLNAESPSDIPVIPLPASPWIGDAFAVGDLEYRVNSVALKDTVGGKHSQTEPSDGAHWVRVDYEAKNIGKSTTTVPTNRVRLIDSDDRVFSPSSKGMTAVTISEGKDMIVSQFQPGIANEQVAVFEVPTVAAKNFQLVFPQVQRGNQKAVKMPFGWPTLEKPD